MVECEGFSLAALPAEVIRAHSDGPFGLKLTRLPCAPKTTKYHIMLDVDTPSVYVPNQNIDNLLYAAHSRVFGIIDGGKWLPLLKGDPQVFKNRTRKIRRKLGGIIKSRHPVNLPLSAHEFISGYSKWPRKMLRYIAALESLNRFDLRDIDAYVKVFIKKEKLLKQVSRLISPRDPRFLLSIGRYIKPIEHKVYKCLSKLKRSFVGDVVSKGFNAEQVGELISRKMCNITDCVVVSWDMKKFDAHFRKFCIEFENEIYLDFYSGADKQEFAYLLKQCLENKCFGYCLDGKVKWQTDGGRMSGDMQTSLGACLIMVIMMVTFLTECGVSTFDILDNGDDILTFLPKKDLHKLNGYEKWFESMGFRIKQENIALDIEDVLFCHTKPVWTPVGYIMVRLFPESVNKDLTCVTSVTTLQQLRSWYTAVGKGGLSLTSRIPILRNFYNFCLRCGEGAQTNLEFFSDSGFAILANGMEVSKDEIHDDTRVSFYKAFDIQPEWQLLLERYYDNLTSDFSSWKPNGASKHLNN